MCSCYGKIRIDQRMSEAKAEFVHEPRGNRIVVRDQETAIMFHVGIARQQLIEYVCEKILPAQPRVDLLFTVDILIDADVESIAVAGDRNLCLIVVSQRGAVKAWSRKRIVVIQQRGSRRVDALRRTNVVGELDPRACEAGRKRIAKCAARVSDWQTAQSSSALGGRWNQ